ncbi:hypothetical protein BLA60_37075 [Actinophytocola xinjiangensis]|uniref:Thymidylate kinase n=1 Tax=Actinophytocola xinjiangensis TaxID=485602 RepID=A0A7Z0WE87_9PSEU|nr:hypothetical protein [Actinophytocola xinjiangensis]OLF05270.1 hypothetical protein BLA60_37075 [Actinophytocola xinjiangensis]
MTPFWTLLGPDFAGKSSALAGLRAAGVTVVSHDDEFLGERALVSKVRGLWIPDALPFAGTRYTHELVLSVMHPVILHQRDALARQAGPGPVVIDSYYYKPMAACALRGVTHEPTFDHWRSFPRPEGVVYLDVPPAVTWARAGDGALASVFEHYGAEATEESFTRFQHDLRERMFAEIGDLPVTVVDGTEPPEAVLAKVVAAVGAVS